MHPRVWSRLLHVTFPLKNRSRALKATELQLPSQCATSGYDGCGIQIDNALPSSCTLIESFPLVTTTFLLLGGCLQRKGSTLPTWQICVRSPSVYWPVHCFAPPHYSHRTPPPPFESSTP